MCRSTYAIGQGTAVVEAADVVELCGDRYIGAASDSDVVPAGLTGGVIGSGNRRRAGGVESEDQALKIQAIAQQR